MRYTKNRREEAQSRKEIIVKKVIISAKGFAVAGTTNKAEPVGRSAPQKGLKREGNGSVERELRITALISRIISGNQ